MIKKMALALQTTGAIYSTFAAASSTRTPPSLPPTRLRVRQNQRHAIRALGGQYCQKRTRFHAQLHRGGQVGDWLERWRGTIENVLWLGEAWLRPRGGGNHTVGRLHACIDQDRGGVRREHGRETQSSAGSAQRPPTTRSRAATSTTRSPIAILPSRAGGASVKTRSLSNPAEPRLPFETHAPALGKPATVATLDSTTRIN